MRLKTKYPVLLTKLLLLLLLLLLKIKYLKLVIQSQKLTIKRKQIGYITTHEFNKLTSESFTASLVQANLASKSDIAIFVKETDFDDKQKILDKNITLNKAKHVPVENELN